MTNTLVLLGVVSAWVTLLTLIGSQNGLSPTVRSATAAEQDLYVSISSSSIPLYASQTTVDLSNRPTVVAYFGRYAYVKKLLLPTSSPVPISYSFQLFQTVEPILVSSRNRYVFLSFDQIDKLNIENNVTDQSNGTLVQLFLNNNVVVSNYSIGNVNFVTLPNVTLAYSVGLTIARETRLKSIGNVVLSAPCINTNIDQNDNLESIGNINAVQVQNLLSVYVESNPSLTYVGNVTIASTASGVLFSFFGDTLLGDPTISRILQAFDESGATSNFANFYGTALPGGSFLSPAGLAAALSLAGKGWNFFGW